MLQCPTSSSSVSKYEPSDYVKFEIKDEATGEAEWMWLRVDRSDDAERIVFGWLDSQPVVLSRQLRLGQHLAVSFDNIRDHRKANESWTGGPAGK